MCIKLRLNFTFTENKSTFLVLVYFVPYPDSLQLFKDKSRKQDLTLAHIYSSLITFVYFNQILATYYIVTRAIESFIYNFTLFRPFSFPVPKTF
jgi:putative IMPACT (imprinted ancient) family translation regulator